MEFCLACCPGNSSSKPIACRYCWLLRKGTCPVINSRRIMGINNLSFKWYTALCICRGTNSWQAYGPFPSNTHVHRIECCPGACFYLLFYIFLDYRQWKLIVLDYNSMSMQNNSCQFSAQLGLAGSHSVDISCHGHLCSEKRGPCFYINFASQALVHYTSGGWSYWKACRIGTWSFHGEGLGCVGKI